MKHTSAFFINGQWVAPHSATTFDIVSPTTERPCETIILGDEIDVDNAVSAARAAFAAFGQTSQGERIALLERVIEVYHQRSGDMAAAITREMGAPVTLARGDQTQGGLDYIEQILNVLRGFEFERTQGNATFLYEPIGVCALITPWNWPISQITAKVAPALAAGCTMVLKPSEVAPLSAIVFAEILQEAGVPSGVFNLVQGSGPTVGAALACHAEVDMVSFTGSTRAGVDVARNAAATVKRVTQELGGKSPNIILDDCDLDEVLTRDISAVYINSGQSCDAQTRILVPQTKMDEAIDIARRVAEAAVVGDPADERTDLGPVVSATQFDRIQALIQSGIDEGATLVTGGPGKPTGLESGYYIRPTVFANVANEMTIAQEEIFGPVVSIIGYEDEGDAVRIANDTKYGLSSSVSSRDPERARRVARLLRAGDVHINGAEATLASVPFGGYKQSGNGREGGVEGLGEYLEVKVIVEDVG